MGGLTASPFNLINMKHLIHGLTLSLLLFNLGWGLYLVTITYRMSAMLLGFAVFTSLLAAAAILYFVALTTQK